MFLGTDSTSVQSVGATPQTYIVAKNPLVLAHLLRENQSRPIDPQAYTTPASVFNTLAVDFAEKIPENDPKYVEKILLDPTTNIPLHTRPIPMKNLQQLDPVVSETSTSPLPPTDDAQSQASDPNAALISFPSDPNNSVGSSSSGTLSKDTMAFSVEKDEILKVIIGHKDTGNLSQNLTPQIQMTASLSSCSDFSLGNFSQISSLPSDSRRSSVNLDQSVASNNSTGIYVSKSTINQSNIEPVTPNASQPPIPLTIQTDLSADTLDQSSADSVSQNSNQSQSSPRNLSVCSDGYANRIRSLERNTHIQGLSLSQSSTSESYNKRIGSLERNSKIMSGFDSLGRKASYGNAQKSMSQSHTGSLQRQFSVPTQVPVYPVNFTNVSQPPINQIPNQYVPPVNQFAYQSSLNASLAASVANKKQQPEPPLIEEIYDFGGENVRSCASIAANKAGLNRSNQSGYFTQAVSVSSNVALQARPHTQPIQYRSATPNSASSSLSNSPRTTQPYMGVQGHLSRVTHLQGHPVAQKPIQPDQSLESKASQAIKNLQNNSMAYVHIPNIMNQTQFSYAAPPGVVHPENIASSYKIINPELKVAHSASNISLGAQVLNMATPAPPSMSYQQRCLEVTSGPVRTTKSGLPSSHETQETNELSPKYPSEAEVKKYGSVIACFHFYFVLRLFLVSFFFFRYWIFNLWFYFMISIDYM